MRRLFDSFRLLGYKINELHNGHFITMNSCGKQSLFDSKGNLLIGNSAKIVYLTDSLYVGKNISKLGTSYTIYDKYGNIIDKASELDMKTANEYTDISYIRNNYIKVRYTDSKGVDRHRLFSKDFKAKFKEFDCKAPRVINNDGEYKLVYRDDGNRTFTINQNDKITEINTDAQLYTLNDHYLVCGTDNFCEYNVKDYKGNKVYTGHNIELDRTSLQSDNIIGVNGEHLDIVNKNGEVIKRIDTNSANSYSNIRTVYFTSEPDVVCIQKQYGCQYLLNIKTNQKSSEYRYIDKENFIGDNQGENNSIALLDRKTLKETQEISNYAFWRTEKGITIVVTIDDNFNENKQYYTLDFKPLVHEFD